MLKNLVLSTSFVFLSFAGVATAFADPRVEVKPPVTSKPGTIIVSKNDGAGKNVRMGSTRRSGDLFALYLNIESSYGYQVNGKDPKTLPRIPGFIDCHKNKVNVHVSKHAGTLAVEVSSSFCQALLSCVKSMDKFEEIEIQLSKDRTGIEKVVVPDDCSNLL